MSERRTLRWRADPSMESAALKLASAQLYPRTGRAAGVTTMIVILAMGALWGVAVVAGGLDEGFADAIGARGRGARAVSAFLFLMAPILMVVALMRWVPRRAFEADVAARAGGEWSAAQDEDGLAFDDPLGAQIRAPLAACGAMRATPAFAMFQIGAHGVAWVPAAAFANAQDYAAFVETCAARLTPKARERSKLKVPA